MRLGVEPSRAMAEVALQPGISVVQTPGERLPFRTEQFAFALLVTVICFVDSLLVLLGEVRRVRRSGGRIIIAFTDRKSHLGRMYESRKAADTFYRVARFYSVAEVSDHVRRAGFGKLESRQSVFDLPDGAPDDQPVRDGFGEAFVVLSVAKERKRISHDQHCQPYKLPNHLERHGARNLNRNRLVSLL